MDRTYRIEDLSTGAELGDYRAPTPGLALDALARSMAYRDWRDLQARAPRLVEQPRVTQVRPRGARPRLTLRERMARDGVYGAL